MCGRFTISKKIKEIEDFFDVEIDEELFKESFNAAPSQKLPVITNLEKNKVNFFKWGLIPSWAKDESIGNKLINARAETIKEKPSFRRSLKEKRCLIIADGFYEWKQEKQTKQPFRITLKDHSVFAFAGLWDKWNNGEGKDVFSFTIITTTPNELMKQIHHRMPVILNRDAGKFWISDTKDVDDICKILVPYPAEEMISYPVSKEVNSPVNNHSGLLTLFEEK